MNIYLISLFYFEEKYPSFALIIMTYSENYVLVITL